ncbi:MAG: cation:proton antiporter [Chloroflexi bacterium]|nr:cation:proton antiporter [Chloroflexota bacterium]
MPESFALDFVIVVAAALLGGIVARSVRLPAMVGFLLAGIAVGPYTPGPVTSLERVNLVATLGVAFLMFALGAQFHLSKLRRYLGLTVFGATIQVVLTAGLTILIAWPFHLPIWQAALFGIFISMSSTVVLAKLLEDRGMLDSLYGKMALSIALGQDLLSVPMIALLPFLGQELQVAVPSIALVLGRAVAIIAVAYLVGLYLLPWLLDRVAAQARELFLLSVVLIAVGVAMLLEQLGVSFILGAFIAGLVIADSRYSGRILAEAVPLRDIFAPFFFVSVGMLFDLRFVGANLGLVALTVILVILGKLLIITAVALLFRYPARSALLAGFALAQVGEFSFVLAQLALTQGVIQHNLFSLVIACALVSIFVSPLLMAMAGPTAGFLERIPVLGRAFRGLEGVNEAPPKS